MVLIPLRENHCSRGYSTNLNHRHLCTIKLKITKGFILVYIWKTTVKVKLLRILKLWFQLEAVKASKWRIWVKAMTLTSSTAEHWNIIRKLQIISKIRLHRLNATVMMLLRKSRPFQFCRVNHQSIEVFCKADQSKQVQPWTLQVQVIQ